MARTARTALLQLPAFSIEDAASSLEHTLRRTPFGERGRLNHDGTTRSNLGSPEISA